MAKVVGEVAIDVTADIAPLVRQMKRGETAMDGLNGAADRAARGLKAFGNKAEALGKTMSAVSAAIGAVVGGAFLLVKGTADSAREIKNLARLSNTSTDEFQRMAAGARTVGIEQDKLADILKDVNDRVGDFNATGGGPMADFFENIAPKVGVTADQFARLSGPEALQLYVDSLNKAGLSQADMTFYMEAMASDATALLPLLANNGAEMKRLGDAAQNAGGVMDSSAIAAADKFNTSLTNLQTAFQGVRDKFAVTLMPVMTRLMDLVTANIVPAIDIAVTKFGEFISFVEGLPGPVLEAVGVIGAALGVGGPIILGIGLVSKVIGGLVAATGPIGLLIAAASLLVAAWQVWGDDIKRIVGAASQYFTENFTQLNAAIGVFTEGMKQQFTNVVDFITALFNGDMTTAFDALTKIMQLPFTVMDGILKAFGINVQQSIGAAVTFMTDQFNAFLEFVRGIPAQLMEIGSQMIQGLLDGILLKWEELKAKIYELGSMLPEWMREMLDIHSPSRVFEEIGGYIGEGLANGIAQSQSMVNAAVGTLANAAVASTQGMASEVLGILGQMFQGSKKIAIAQAAVNAFQGASEALKLPFPKNILAFGKVLATGAQAIRGIKSTTIGGGGGSGGLASAGSAAASAPQSVANITLNGDTFSRGSVEDLFSQINDGLRQGRIINLVRA